MPNKQFTVKLFNPTGGAIVDSPNPANVSFTYAADTILGLVESADSGAVASSEIVGMITMPSTNDKLHYHYLRVPNTVVDANWKGSNIFRVSDEYIALICLDNSKMQVHRWALSDIMSEGPAYSAGAVTIGTAINHLRHSVIEHSPAGGANYMPNGIEWSCAMLDSNGILYWVSPNGASFGGGTATDAVIYKFDVVNGVFLEAITVTFSLIATYGTRGFVAHGIDASGYLICGHTQRSGATTYRYKIYRIDPSDGSVVGSHTVLPSDLGMNASGENFTVIMATAGTGTNDSLVFHQQNRTTLVRLHTWVAGAATLSSVGALTAGDALLPNMGVVGNIAYAVNNSTDLVKLENVVSGSYARSVLTAGLVDLSAGNGTELAVGCTRLSATEAAFVSYGSDFVHLVNLSTGAVTASLAAEDDSSQLVQGETVDANLPGGASYDFINEGTASWSTSRYLESQVQGAR